MNLTIALNWWQMCLLIAAVTVVLLYLIDKTAYRGSWAPDIWAMLLYAVVLIGGIAMIVGIILGKFVFVGG